MDWPFARPVPSVWSGTFFRPDRLRHETRALSLFRCYRGCPIPRAFAHRPGAVLCICVRDVVAGALPVSPDVLVLFVCRLMTVSLGPARPWDSLAFASHILIHLVFALGVGYRSMLSSSSSSDVLLMGSRGRLPN